MSVRSISITMSAVACSMKHSAMTVLCTISTIRTEIRREYATKPVQPLPIITTSATGEVTLSRFITQQVCSLQATTTMHGGVTTTHSTDADTQNIADLNPLRYRGYYYDSETSMYYVNSRYYDPATKRFLNSDNWNILKSQSDLYDKNLYSYCDNNPLMNKDLDGNIWIAAVAVGVGSQYASDIICNLIAGEKGKDIFIPTSSLGDYISAGVTALIPGSGITSALMRSVVSVGISGIENSIKGEKFTIAQYSMDFLGNLLLDVGVSAVAGKVSRLIDSKLPKNYSTYAGQQYKKHAQITARQISKKMANKYKLGRGAANVFEFMLNTIGNVL